MPSVVQTLVLLDHVAYITVMPLSILLKRTSVATQVCVLWFSVVQILPQLSGLLCNTTSFIAALSKVAILFILGN